MIGVVADDLTGANDIGLMFAKHGYLVEVLNRYDKEITAQVHADVLILDTNSRCDDPATAYRKVWVATKLLLPLDCSLLIKKTCSVFRGNVGTEFDAMLDAAAADFAVVVAGFPKNGRITRDGQHFVHGRPLAESEFAVDPVHPMCENDLLKIIAHQSKRPIRLLDYRTVAAGPAAVREAVAIGRSRGGYLVSDITSQLDLHVLAEACAQEPFLFGSSALAEELPDFWPKPFYGPVKIPKLNCKTGSLIVAGSVTPQTKSQVASAREAGIATAELNSRHLIDENTREQELQRLEAWATPLLQAGWPVLIHSSHQPEDIAATQRLAGQAGMDRIATGRLVAACLGELSLRIITTTRAAKLIVAGGETAAAVCGSLGIDGNVVLKEIQPGLPSGLSRGKYQLLLVLKSGSFGSPDFFRQALNHLEELTN